MNELALFTGAGGGILGSLLLGWETVCGVEIDPYCREVLLRRQEDGHLPPFPIWDDIKTFDGRPWNGRVHIITAGFPCQPFSCAGLRAGESDDRNLWPDTIRVIREVGPWFVLLENVADLIIHEYFGTILGDLAESGFCVRWDCIPASAVGAPHRRDRLWILAYSDKSGLEGGEQKPEARLQQMDKLAVPQCFPHTLDDLPESIVFGSKHGLAYFVDRTKAIGNGQVPAVVVAAWKLLGRNHD